MARLKALPRLQKLEVYGPWCTDAGLAAVSRMDHLEIFVVSAETSVTAAGLEQLQNRRPALYVVLSESGRVDKARLRSLRDAVGYRPWRDRLR